MDFKLSQQEDKLKRSFRELCKGTLEAAAAEVDSSGRIPDGHWQALADFGYLGFGLDAGGHSLLQWTLLGEDLAGSCASTFAAVLASSHLFGAIVQRHGSEAQKQKYLPGISKGAIKAAVALTDPKGAPDSAPHQTLAKEAGDGAVLDGIKPYVTNGPICDVALVLAVTESASTFLIVESDTDGLDRGERMETMGIRGCAVGPLSFDGCVVPRENILGDWNRAERILDDLMTLRRIWWAVYGVGTGQACIDAAIDHAAKREIDGKNISKHEEIHFKVAEMHMGTDTARQLARKAAWLVDEGQKADIIAAAAKLLATESATDCSHKAVQIHGGKGFVRGSTVERLYRDARLGEIEGETSEILRVLLARDVLDKHPV